MEALLALIGALIGGIVTVQYMYAADRRKIRAEVVLEVVSYCDEIYHLIQSMHGIKQVLFTPEFPQKPQASADYGEASRRLTVLLKTSAARVKLAIAYGDGDALGEFNALADQFRHVTTILRHASPATWTEEDQEIHRTFREQIDPMRQRLEKRLLSDALPASIWVLLRRG